MKAILLAAGVGKRLWPVTQHHPKCLIELGGRTLLLRYLEALAGVGIKQAVVVVGYKQDMIRAAVGTGGCGVEVRYLVNEQYQRGSMTSLWLARAELDEEYEDALHEFFTRAKVGFEKIGGLPWIEIDFPEDVTRAERDVLTKLD